jgi:Uma2 family endonuclease
VASSTVTKLTEERYLALDRAAEFRSEFLDGEMLPRLGVSLRHAQLQSNLCGELYISLRDRGCKPLGSGLRIRVSSRMYAYADVSVVRGQPLLADEHEDELLNPVAIVEVLSPATEQYDRGVKFQHYRTMDSLKEYILVDQDQVLVEQYTRNADDTWSLRDYRSLDGELKLGSLGVSIPLRSVYDRVELPAA